MKTKNVLSRLTATSIIWFSLLTASGLMANANELAVAKKDQAVVQPIINLFDAMRAHNGDKLKAQFTDQAMLQRAKNDNTIVNADIAQFAAGISKSKNNLNEVLLSAKVQQQDNLATVWTPFVFYLDGKVSHCGINSFQMVKIDNQWKIHYLIDNKYQGDCDEFINSQK
jgi:hypothetical protein